MSFHAAFPRAGVVCLAGLLLISGAARGQNPLTDDGLFVAVRSPIDSGGVALIKNRVEAARKNTSRPVRKIVFDFTPAGKDAATADFGVCYSLGAYISQLHEFTTIGFATAGVSGHAVLPLLACKEIALGRGASVGEIVTPADPQFTPAMTASYDEVLGTSREPIRAVVRKMADRGVSLGKGQKNGAAWFIDLRDRDKLQKAGIVIPDPTPLPFAVAGVAGIFTADKAKLVGLSNVTAETRQDVADLYRLSPTSLRDDPLNGRPPTAFRYLLRGPIDGGVRESTRRVVQDVVNQKGNILFLEIECAGGDLSAARDIADDLLKAQQGENALLVVGFIPTAAPDTAAVIALGCGELVMSKNVDAKNPAEATEATLGDFDAVLNRREGNDVEFLRKNLKELAAQQGVPEILIDGMLDRDLVIIRAHATNERGRRRLMREAEFEAEKANWVSEGTIKTKGAALKLTATRAAELGLTRFTVDTRDPAGVYALYGLEAVKVKEATPGWLDRFADYLRKPPVTVLLVVIGFIGLVLELKLPGTTVPGIVAALCFILVFWAHTGVNGNAAILGGMIFLLGLVLILLELFVIPGFGAPGIVGILFMIGGIGLATVDRIPQTGDDWIEFGGKLGQYALGMMGGVGIAFMIARYLPHIPYANRMMLEPPADSTDPGAEPDLPGAAVAAALLGAVGAAATTLRPAGMAQFGDQYVDVVSEGGYIPAGARVRVVEVEGTRVVVKEV